MDYYLRLSSSFYFFLIGMELGKKFFVEDFVSLSIGDILVFAKKFSFLLLTLYLLKDWFIVEYVADDVATVKIQIYDLLLTISLTYFFFKYSFSLDFIKEYKHRYGRKIWQWIQAWQFKNVDKILFYKKNKKNYWLEHPYYSNSLHEARHALAFYPMRELFYKAQVDKALAQVVSHKNLDSVDLKYQQGYRIMLLAGCLDKSSGGGRDRQQWEFMIKLLLEENVIQLKEKYYYKNPQTNIEIESNSKIMAEIYQQDLQAARAFVANNYLLIEELALLLNRKKVLYYRDLIPFWNRVKRK